MKRTPWVRAFMVKHIRRCSGSWTLGGSAMFLGLLLMGAGPSVASADEGGPGGPQGAGGHRPTRGETLYLNHCAPCHGAEGQGDGAASHILFPRPRDFTKGHFRLRSTRTATPPTDEDLMRVVTRGIPGSSMPAFAFLAEADRTAIVQYTKSLSPMPAQGAGPAPVDLGPPPPRTPEAVAAGKQVYERLSCANCHDDEGHGDGAIADDLVDDTGLHIRPRDLTTGVYKGGSTARDIVLRLATGMDGTPMPAYPDAKASALERWQLAYYVESLFQRGQTPRVAAAPEPARGMIVSGRLKKHLPKDDPLAPEWNRAPAYRVPLFPLWAHQAPPSDLTVRALHDGQTIAFLLEWTDTTRNDQLLRTEDFRDGAAIQLLPGAGDAFLGMGDARTPVTIWHWKADWQREVERKKRSDITEAFPGAFEDPYPFPVEPGREAENLQSLPHRATPVEEASAHGFGSLAPRSPVEQKVMGRGVWVNGRWRVVLAQSLASLAPGGAQPRSAKLAFAIWDGARQERGGQKSISTWYELMVQVK